MAVKVFMHYGVIGCVTCNRQALTFENHRKRDTHPVTVSVIITSSRKRPSTAFKSWLPLIQCIALMFLVLHTEHLQSRLRSTIIHLKRKLKFLRVMWLRRIYRRRITAAVVILNFLTTKHAKRYYELSINYIFWA